ncbi:SPOR domain-containing protein [Luteimonas sp. MJ293]|uniref:SPOR domain-containing protein n=1 Tax=Luteimonas sp. MJ146 TaxID=3129240 RepID=UPI0031B9D2F7
MDSGLKQRLIGAAVLVALAVIFLPMLVKGPAPDSGVSDLSLDMPDRPQSDMVTRELPLVAPRPQPDDGALGLGAREREGMSPDGTLPTVDTAREPHPDAALPADGPAVPEPDAVAGSGEPAEAPASEPAPAAEPAETALPAAVAGGDYAVRFGSYGNSVNADTVVNRLKQANLPASSVRVEVAGQTVWRVHIGPYASRAQAEAVRVRAATIGTNDARVVSLDAAPAQPRQQQAAAATPPATPTPTPAPATPAAAPDVGFVVQLGAFSSAGDANALRDRVRAQGFNAFTQTVQTADRGVLTRVNAGPVVSRAEAERLKAQVQDKVQVEGMVRSHP